MDEEYFRFDVIVRTARHTEWKVILNELSTVFGDAALLFELLNDGQNGFLKVQKKFKIKKELEDQSRRRYLETFDKFVILLIMILISRLMNLKQKMVQVTEPSNELLKYFAYIYKVKIQK